MENDETLAGQEVALVQRPHQAAQDPRGGSGAESKTLQQRAGVDPFGRILDIHFSWMFLILVNFGEVGWILG